jgi:hypothetical protein
MIRVILYDAILRPRNNSFVRDLIEWRSKGHEPRWGEVDGRRQIWMEFETEADAVIWKLTHYG